MENKQPYKITVWGLAVVLGGSLFIPEADKERFYRQPDAHQESRPYLPPDIRGAALVSTASGDSIVFST